MAAEAYYSPSSVRWSPTARALLRAREWVRRVGAEHAIACLARAGRPWDGAVRFTFWSDGVTSTWGARRGGRGRGLVRRIPFDEYASGSERYARENIFPKGEGIVLAHGLTRSGGSCDQECEEIDWLFGDADGVGDWEQLHDALVGAGLAHVLQRSGGHRADCPRFHLELPLARPLVVPAGKFREWKQNVYRPEYGWLLGVLSEIGGLACDHSNPSKLGFDGATDRLLAPVYLGCRRTPDAAVPVTVAHEGLALDWQAALDATGYVPEVVPVGEGGARPPARGSRAQGGGHGDGMGSGLVRRVMQRLPWRTRSKTDEHGRLLAIIIEDPCPACRDPRACHRSGKPSRGGSAHIAPSGFLRCKVEGCAAGPRATGRSPSGEAVGLPLTEWVRRYAPIALPALTGHDSRKVVRP